MADALLKADGVVPAAVCQDFATASRLEWLQTNHTGAFAMGTVSGVNTRRYHGLLIATLNPPTDRYSVFPRVEETVECAGTVWELAAVQYPGTVTPSGYQILEEFSSLPCPTWRYRCGSLVVTKSAGLVDGEQSAVLSYSASSVCQLKVRLFVSFRDYHSLMRQNSSLDSQVRQVAGQITIRPYADLPPLHFQHDAEQFEPNGQWFQNHEYLRELERGLDYREDLYSPGVLRFQMTPERVVKLIATLEERTSQLEVSSKPLSQPVAQALDPFRVRRADGRPTLMAGYPWFTDWSRDTLISLPAFLAWGFPAEETRAILEFLLAERKQGILPNRFSDKHSAPEYNTVDASLWFFVAAHFYMKQAEDDAFLQQTLFPAGLDILEWHRRGTFYGIHVDPADHLLAAGEPGMQLTWMDAKIGDYVVTPRMGKPVEINALWFNALEITRAWAERLGKVEIAGSLEAEAALVKASFGKKFWNVDRQCLYDVVTADGADASLRPNQLFALSLPFPLVDRERAQAIVQTVRQFLMTPVGLRTLEPSDAKYCPHYAGDTFARDSAYHQGTVWPWLVGPFVDASLYAFGDSAEARAECRAITDSLARLMNEYGLGSIAEVYDGDAPHRAGGCPAQLWSVAQFALVLKRLSDR